MHAKIRRLFTLADQCSAQTFFARTEPGIIVPSLVQPFPENWLEDLL